MLACAALTGTGFLGGYQLRGNLEAAKDARQQEKALEDFRLYAQGVVDDIQAKWVKLADETGETLAAVAAQRDSDVLREKETLVAIQEVGSEINSIAKQVKGIDRVGACRLDPDFIRLRNLATEAANTGRKGPQHPDP